MSYQDPSRRDHAGRDEALAYVAHELRAPLAAIRGWAGLLEHHELDERARRAVANIAKNAAAQARLIDDLLAHEQIARGLFNLERAPLELTALAASAAESLRPIAAERGTELAVECVHAIVVVHGDAGRLRQVLYNLLMNAIHYSPNGSQVGLRIEQVEEEAVIRVRDSGVGITPTFLPFVFERFRRAPQSKATSGLGLGLAITRDIVELHGGTIDVESTGVDRGTTFVVRLPRFVDTSSYRACPHDVRSDHGDEVSPA